MSQVVVENVPQSFQKRVGTTTDFSNLVGISWDGMDWCQFGEVLPSNNDTLAFSSYKEELSETSGADFLA